MKSNRVTKTDRVELVETHNICLSLKRLREIPGYASVDPWRRAFFHAASMAGLEHSALEKIRVALEIP
jgi:hypothetical protein